MDGHLFIAPGDITQLAAHAIAYSSSTGLGESGALYPAFRDHVPGFATWFEELSLEYSGRCSVGDSYWLPLGSDTRPHGVVVVVAAGGPRTPEDKAGMAVRAAIDAAVPRLRDALGRDVRLLIALPTFRIGWAGDRDHRLRSARAQVIAAIKSLEQHSGVDVAILTYTPAIYQIFLEARRQVLGELPADPTYPQELEHALLAGECVLFVGAGMSRGAGLPDWGAARGPDGSGTGDRVSRAPRQPRPGPVVSRAFYGAESSQKSSETPLATRCPYHGRPWPISC